MNWLALSLGMLAICLPARLALAADPPMASELAVAQVIERNVAARGGLPAWRKIQTMAWIGHIESANHPDARLSFILEQKRQNKTRFEISRQNLASVRVYDGKEGWKLRPSANGTPEVKPYTAEELAFAADGQGIEGPLMDHAGKGIDVTLDGMDEVEGRQSYRLSVKLPSGAVHRIWIDAETFLDIKYDRQSKDPAGRSATLSVFYRDYRNIEGVMVPLTMETGIGVMKSPDRMVIDRVVLNPPLDDRSFARPHVQGGRHGAIVDTR
ncbi:MAG TPA: hypothetical protein VFF82_05940, partial [Rhodocyclaceae bacterium]|nr:hypothetical protein [Rhodocyclaceae bacterium]